ncbi:phage tail protein [Chitinibacter sp. GC72]|uniref:phage tail protein n=1 Tax=Chitinibacter sp. GC72 TaxID=1526917 RepID=UPI0012FC698D|nr:phage tail protein [Chitinibacter sp. GC72]
MPAVAGVAAWLSTSITVTVGGASIAIASYGTVIAFAATTAYGMSRSASMRKKARAAAAAQRAEMNVKVNTVDSVGALPIVYGRARVGGLFALQAVSPDKKYLYLALAHSEGRCGIPTDADLYLDDVHWKDDRFKFEHETQVPREESGVSAGGQAYTQTVYDTVRERISTVEWFYHDGNDGQAADAKLLADLPQWTAAHKLSGVAYSVLVLRFEPDVWRAMPVITLDLPGVQVFDPRTGLYGASSNPALALRDYLLSERYGRGLPLGALDVDSFIAAANYCDALIDMGHKNADGSIKLVPRYEINGILDTSKPTLDNVQILLDHMRGSLLFSEGKYSLVIDQADVSVMTFDENNMTGGWQVKAADRRGKLNAVTARFVDPLRQHAETIVTVKSPSWLAEDAGLVLESTLEFSLASDERRARFLATRVLRDSRNGFVVTFKAFAAAGRLQPTDVISISHGSTGWINKRFRVLTVKPLISGDVEITAHEYDPSLYADDPLTAAPPPVDSSLPDPFAPLAAPGNLVVVIDNNLAAPALLATWDVPIGFVIGYQVRWRHETSPDWLSQYTRELAASLPVWLEGNFFVEVRAQSAMGKYGNAAEVLATFAPAALVGVFPRPASAALYGRVNDAGDMNNAKLVLKFDPALDDKPDGVMFNYAVTDAPNGFRVRSGSGTGSTIKIEAVAELDKGMLTALAGSDVHRVVTATPEFPNRTNIVLAGIWAKVGASAWRKVVRYDSTSFYFEQPLDVAPQVGDVVEWVDIAWVDDRMAYLRLGILTDGTNYEIVRWGGVHSNGAQHELIHCERAIEGSTLLAADGLMFYYFPAAGLGTTQLDLPAADFSDLGGGTYSIAGNLDLNLPAGGWASASVYLYKRTPLGIARSFAMPVSYGGEQ